MLLSADFLDCSLYLDISEKVKLSWKTQHDLEERWHYLESIMASIAPQNAAADFSQMIPILIGCHDDYGGRIGMKNILSLHTWVDALFMSSSDSS